MTSVRSGLSSMSLYSLPTSRTAARGGSVYGGAGGRNVRVSYSSNNLGSGFDLMQALEKNDNFSISSNEKATMQNLNDRLASYLEKVRKLESANAELERQILEWYERKTPAVTDYSRYWVIIEDLRNKIKDSTLDNTGLILQIDNGKLAAEDFRMKYENELALKTMVVSDIAGLRKVLDDMTLSRSDLEMQVEGLKEECSFMKKNHEEEMAELRSQISSSSVDVVVDPKPQEDLSVYLEEIRSQYEDVVQKNRREMDAWYKVKYDELNKQMASSTEVLQTSQSEINDLRRKIQALEIELQSELSLKSAMEGQLAETENRYSMQLGKHQAMVDRLEKEITEMRVDIERQSTEYQILLDIKTRLELEIAEYRRLLDGDDVPKPVVVEVKVKEAVKEEVKEERKPVITKRTKVVIEELVDGKVVSRTEDVDTTIVNQ